MTGTPLQRQRPPNQSRTGNTREGIQPYGAGSSGPHRPSLLPTYPRLADLCFTLSSYSTSLIRKSLKISREYEGGKLLQRARVKPRQTKSFPFSVGHLPLALTRNPKTLALLTSGMSLTKTEQSGRYLSTFSVHTISSDSSPSLYRIVTSTMSATPDLTKIKSGARVPPSGPVHRFSLSYPL